MQRNDTRIANLFFVDMKKDDKPNQVSRKYFFSLIFLKKKKKCTKEAHTPSLSRRDTKRN